MQPAFRATRSHRNTHSSRNLGRVVSGGLFSSEIRAALSLLAGLTVCRGWRLWYDVAMTESGSQLVLRRIVSGGQTGVDRGALDAAIELGLEHGGWCPRGRRAEDGPIPLCYRLRETASAKYPARTKQNVVESDATLLFYRDRLHSGTELTFRLVKQHAKPYLLVDLETQLDPAVVLAWLTVERVETLNVAGPRESSAPGIAGQTHEFLTVCLASASETS